MPSLTHKRPDAPDRTLPISEKALIVGRVPESDIVVRDTFVSRVHCGIGHVDGKFTLKDLGSTNGTYRNGARVFQCSLSTGDKIQVGNTTLVFEIGTSPDEGLLRQVPQMVAPAPSASPPAAIPRPSEKQLTIPVRRPPGAGQSASPGLRPS